MRYRVRYGTEAATKHIPGLDPSIRERVCTAIETKLTLDPRHFGKPLQYALRNLRVLRVGDWRVIFQCEAYEVVVLAVRHRKEGYDDFS